MEVALKVRVHSREKYSSRGFFVGEKMKVRVVFRVLEKIRDEVIPFAFAHTSSFTLPSKIPLSKIITSIVVEDHSNGASVA